MLVHAGDTDIYMYGLALYEQGHLQQKQVCVERVKNAEYVSIDVGISLMKNVPELNQLIESKRAALTLLCVYIFLVAQIMSVFFLDCLTNLY